MEKKKAMKNQLETFRENFLHVRVWVEPDYMVYKTRRGLAKALAEEANLLIDKMGLSLSAIPTKSSSQDSISVQSNEIGYV
jgi:hypothetical protein